MVTNLSTLSAIYFEPPQSFVKISSVHADRKDSIDEDEEEDDDDDEEDEEEESDTENEPTGAKKGNAPAPTSDLLGDLFSTPAPARSTVASNGSSGSFNPLYPNLVDEAKGQGVSIYGTIAKVDGVLALVLQFNNKSSTPIDVINIQFNKNTFGLAPQSSNKFDAPVAPGSFGNLKIPITYNKAFANPGVTPTLAVNAAMQNATTNVVYYFNLSVVYHALFANEGKLADQDFITMWTSELKDKALSFTVSNLQYFGPDAVKGRLQANGYFFIAQRNVAADQQVIFFNSKTDQSQIILFEVTLKDGVNAAKLCIKTDNGTVAQFAKSSIEYLLTSK